MLSEESPGDPFIVRAYQAGDEQAILDLFHRKFHPRRSLLNWRWKFGGNPFGREKISVAFSPTGELVAHYAGYPIPFRTVLEGSARTLLALQIGDTMTDPSVRGIGRGTTSLLGRTVRHFYAQHCAGRVAFNYGFNRGKIQRFSLRSVNARRIEAVPFWVLDLALRPAASLGRGGLLSGVRVEPLTELTTEWDDLLARALPHYGFLVQRDARYLRWRYVDNPEATFAFFAVRHRGRLQGWGVFRREEDSLLWGDALFDPDFPAAPQVLLREILALPQFRGVRRVQAWFSDRPAWWVDILSGMGFGREAEPNHLALMAVPFTEPAAATALLPRLYYTWGDSDLF